GGHDHGRGGRRHHDRGRGLLPTAWPLGRKPHALPRGTSAYRGCPPPLANCSRACGRTGRTASRHSRTPFGEPGRFTINERPRTTATALESAAIGVSWREMARMTSARPGTWYAATPRVACGVTSRGERPVPPLVT